MAIEQFYNGELLESVRSKLNANDVELDSRLTVVENQLQSIDSYYTKPDTGIPESDLSASVQTKLNAVGGGGAETGDNTDITALSGLTGGIQEVDFILFDTTPEAIPNVPGTIYWDSADNAKTLSVVMATSGTTLQVGQEQYYRVKASTPITNGQVVMSNGAQGNSGLMLGVPAAGVPVNRPELVLGLATENIAANVTGYVTCFGLVRGINTTGSAQSETWVDGDTLYYNPLVVGGLTKVRPVAPNPIVTIGNVISAASNGSIFVKVHHSSTFGYSDGNVQITSPQNNDFVVYDGSQQRWENYTPAAARTALGLGTAATQNSTAFATASQGAKADTALQSIPVATTTVVGGVKQGSGVSIAGDGTISATGTAAGNATSTVPGLIQLAAGQSAVQLSKVASTGAYADLTGTPTLGTAAAQNTSAFATSSQGAKADTALQQSSADLRYIRTVNGIGPDTSGDVSVSGGGSFDGGSF